MEHVKRYLAEHGRPDLAAHVARVAANAREIGPTAGVSVDDAVTAAWLHDISQVMDGPAMLAMAEARGLPIAPEERQVPFLLHGPLSAVMAAERFGVTEAAVLNAIRCHTTLRARPTALDQVLFVADKLAWNPADAPYVPALRAALATSLDHAVRWYMAYTWERRERLTVVHPRQREAWIWFGCIANTPSAEE